jgi:adenine phosphoribosyltransferase
MSEDGIVRLKASIRDVPDFPKKGIIFKDITTLLKDADLFAQSIDQLYDLIKNRSFDVVAAIESRGFIFGSALAYKLNKSFVPIRKPGKLPAKILREEYSLEYGMDSVEIHADAIEHGARVLLVDDLLATGGTAQASCHLIERSGAKIVAILFLIELGFLKGRKLIKEHDILSLICYN